MLFSFTNTSDLSNWEEFSDTIWQVGLSRAKFGYLNSIDGTVHFETMLIPQPNGACFCSYRTHVRFNLEGCDYIDFVCIAQGCAKVYKIILGHEDEKYSNILFEQNFFVSLAICI